MYFGMIIRKYFTETHIKSPGKLSLYCLLVACYLWICYIAYKTDMIWASSHYNSPMIIVGGFAFFGICLTVKHIPKALDFFLQCTTGIWILHPFTIRILNKIYYCAEINTSIYIKCVNFVLCIVLCSLLTYILSRNKIMRKFLVL